MKVAIFRFQFKCKRLFKCETHCLDDSSCSEGTNSTESNNELNDDSESLSSTSSCATIPNEQLISKNISKQIRFYLMCNCNMTCEIFRFIMDFSL